MEHEQLLVWLEAVPEGPTSPQVGMICRRHADAMVVPRGWTLDDRREARPRLFKVVDLGVDRTNEIRRPRVRAVSGPAEAPPQLVFDDVEPDEEVFVEAITVGEIRPLGDHDPEDTQALPWRPAFDQSDDLDGLLSAKSPLLARAFRGARQS